MSSKPHPVRGLPVPIASRKMLADLEEMERAGLIPVCIAICRNALKRLPASDFKNHYAFGIKLVKYLIAFENEPVPPRQTEEALEVLRRTEKLLPSAEKQKKATCWLFLGFLFQNRKRGNKKRNLRQALKWYSLARNTFTRRSYPTEWAGATVALAEVYAGIGGPKTNLAKAIRLTRASLQVYTPNDYPEDNRAYRLAIEKLHNERASP